MKAIGSKTNVRAKENTPLLAVPFTTETGKMTKRAEKVTSIGEMERHMMECG